MLIPVDLRRMYGSKTLRNFVLYVTPGVDPRLGEYTFEELAKIVHHRMALDITEKNMSARIYTNVHDEENPLVRLIPLPLKNAVMKMIFDTVGECKSCLALSNLGKIAIPDNMAAYIQRFDFILGVQAAAPYNCGMLSYGDTLYINFIRDIKESELERHFYAILQQLGLPVAVESN